MSGWQFQRTAEQAQVLAAAKGCVCKTPESNQLFIDLDSEAEVKNFWRLLKAFREQEPCTYVMRPSSSGARGHFHAIVTLERCVTSPLEQIALQAFLGSDTMRELLNWRRMESGVALEANNILFEKTDTMPLSWFRRALLCVTRLWGVA